MIVDILVAGLLALISFRSGMEYQNYKATKEEIARIQRRLDALKESKPEDSSTQNEVCEMKELVVDKPVAESK